MIIGTFLLNEHFIMELANGDYNGISGYQVVNSRRVPLVICDDAAVLLNSARLIAKEC